MSPCCTVTTVVDGGGLDLEERRWLVDGHLEVDLGRPGGHDDDLCLRLGDADDAHRVRVAAAGAPASDDDDQTTHGQQLVLVSDLRQRSANSSAQRPNATCPTTLAAYKNSHGKKKLKILYSAISRELASKALRITRVNEKLHRFTCHPHVYQRIE